MWWRLKEDVNNCWYEVRCAANGDTNPHIFNVVLHIQFVSIINGVQIRDLSIKMVTPVTPPTDHIHDIHVYGYDL